MWLSHPAFGPERISLILADAHEAAYDLLEAIGVTRAQTVLLVTQLIFDGLIPALIVMTTYGFLTWRYGPSPRRRARITGAASASQGLGSGWAK